MDFISVMVVLWLIKTIAEDGWSTVKGTSNPRLDRRRARQKSRGNNRGWNALTNLFGILAEDFVDERERRLREKRAREAEARRKRELEDHETVDAEYKIDPVDVDDPPPDEAEPEVEEETKGRHRDLPDSECTLGWCPFHNKPNNKQDPPDQQGSGGSNQGGSEMPNQAGGDAGHFLDGAIAYCEEAAAGHDSYGIAQGEGFTAAIAQHKVQGQTLATVQEAQAMSSAAAAKWDEAKVLFEEQLKIQEQYRQNQDGGDKDFQTGG